MSAIGDTSDTPIGLYVHVPFCRARCHFCAFYLQIYREDRVRPYVEALVREMELHQAQGTIGSRSLSSIYVGGGTPTTLAPSTLVGMLSRIRHTFAVVPDAEITVEVAPDTVTREDLAWLVDAGVTRLSMGVQSMEPEELLNLGRPILPHQVASAVAAARDAGCPNISLDLIYGLPGQTLGSWQRTLEETIGLAPNHLACYALTVENRTRLAVEIQQGIAAEPDADLQMAMEVEAEAQLARAGFQHYELSNYCQPGFACRHNLLYWQDGDYLGLGPSAQSFVDSCRFGNVADLSAYQAALSRGMLPVDSRETLTSEQRRQEALIFGLRLLEGTDVDRMIDGATSERHVKLVELIGSGLLERAGHRIRLTARGRRFADSVAVELA